MSMRWISDAVARHKGALHRQLGLKPGTPIPVSRLRAAANSKDKKLAKRARLVLTLRSFH